MSDQVGNPEDRFSHNEAHFMIKSPTRNVPDMRVELGVPWIPSRAHIANYLYILYMTIQTDSFCSGNKGDMKERSSVL